MNYYNEIDPKAAAWMQELINEGLIPNGKIDTRSIVDVQPGDLRGFTQAHFFCGIAGWSSEPPGRSASGFWSDSTWHLCRDGKSRRIPAGSESVFQRMVDELPENLDGMRLASYGFPLAPKIQGRAAILKGYGNAIVPELAAEFIKAVMQEIE